MPTLSSFFAIFTDGTAPRGDMVVPSGTTVTLEPISPIPIFTADDELFGGFPDSFETFEWHYYRFELPAGAVLLARNENAPQAYRVGVSAWGTQFHIEAPGATIAEWFTMAADEARSKGTDPEAEIAITPSKDPAHVALAEDLARRFGIVVARYAGERNLASPARTS